MVPLSYIYRNLLVRWRTTLMTACGFALVVSALIVMLAFVNGIKGVCVASGEPENIVITAEGNSDEVFSQLETSKVRELSQSEGVTRNVSGAPLASPELFTVIHHLDGRTKSFEFLHVRGVSREGPQVHQCVKLMSGRWFKPGRPELVMGSAIAHVGRFEVGSKIAIGAETWTIVGIFKADGAAFESEFWCDLDQLASTFRREGIVSSLVLRANSEQGALSLVKSLRESRSGGIELHSEIDYYRKQAEQMESLVVAAWVIAIFMGIGSVFGVMNTMFATINQRKGDIAVLRIIGFSRPQILVAFMLEAIVLATAGTLIGVCVGSAIGGMSQSMLVGSRELQFSFSIDSLTILAVAAFSICLGVLGGLAPAMSAMRVSPLEALRS